MSRKLGQPVVVDNRPGAGGIIAAEALAKSPPDGFTLLVAIQTALCNGRVLYPYSPDRDFAPITLFPAGAPAFGVNATLPIRTPDEYVAWAAKNPAAIGTDAAGSWPHMIADTWNRTHGLKIDAKQCKDEAPQWVAIADRLGIKLD
jgi:tripartite-type tricarboxylate transporter receptor subunit TctC